MSKLFHAAFFVFLLLGILPVRAQDIREDSMTVFFEKDKSQIDTSLSTNYEVLSRILHIVSECSVNNPFELSLIGHASPEGTVAFNEAISLSRAESLLNFIIEHTGFVPDSVSTHVSGAGADWSGLEEMMAGDSSFEHSGRVLSVVRTIPVWVTREGRIVGGRKKSLMDMDGGRVFSSLMDNVFPHLRRVDVVIRYSEAVPVEQVPSLSTAPDVPELPPVPARELPQVPPVYRMALKTNLLADIALMPSLEAEWLINDEWSVAAHGAVAWWSRKPRHQYYQIATIYPEARWWFSTREPWHGHYLGLFAGGTWYDLENGGRGYQGEGGFVGLSYGYMFPIGRRLSLEAGIGLGYLYTRYREYLPVPFMESTHYVYQQTSQMNYFGPLKVKFALVWRLWDVNKKKGGER